MALTPKQERNGIPDAGDGHNTAVPSADMTGDISGLMSEAVAADWKAGTGQKLMLGQNVNDPHVEWDAGLAVGEQAGEA